MILTDERSGSLLFSYDVQTHRLTLVNVERGGETSDLERRSLSPSRPMSSACSSPTPRSSS